MNSSHQNLKQDQPLPVQQCKHCKEWVATSYKICPNCRKTIKPMNSALVGILIFVFGIKLLYYFLFYMGLFTGINSTTAPSQSEQLSPSSSYESSTSVTEITTDASVTEQTTESSITTEPLFETSLEPNHETTTAPTTTSTTTSDTITQTTTFETSVSTTQTTTKATTQATTKATTQATTKATTHATTKTTTRITEPSPEKIKEDYIESCDDGFWYEDVERYPDDYDGKRLAVYGTVMQVLEYKDQAVETSAWEKWFGTQNTYDDNLTYVTYRIEDYMGNTWVVTYVRTDGEARILENDYVAVYGVCQGVETMNISTGGTKTYPALDAKYIELWVEP